MREAVGDAGLDHAGGRGEARGAREELLGAREAAAGQFDVREVGDGGPPQRRVARLRRLAHRFARLGLGGVEVGDGERDAGGIDRSEGL